MHFHCRAKANPRRLAVFPGTFNPITVAHVALANAALSRVDEVVYILPRVLPHKQFTGASFSQRMDLLCAAVGQNEACSVASAEGGLFVEIASECRAAYGHGTELFFLCGRDAAERIVNWDYGYPGAAAEMLRQFHLLVAARCGEYLPPPEFQQAIQILEVAGEFDHVSATDVRERIARGEAWGHLVPPGTVPLVKEFYR